MAQIILNIPDAALARVVEAIAATQGYPTHVQVPGVFPPQFVPNPQPRGQFAKACLVAWMKRQVQVYEADVARQQAEAALQPAPEIT